MSMSPSPSSSRVRRMSAAVEKTVDRFSRSIHSRPSTASTTTPPTSHRKLFSVSRRPKVGDAADESATATDCQPTTDLQSDQQASPAPTSSLPQSFPHKFLLADDSPFITPPSPTFGPTSSPFRGAGSMRAGTQTLIQALQALPWSQIDQDDEIALADSSGDEDDLSEDHQLASSIHTIHRPLARSCRQEAIIPGPVYEEDPSSTCDPCDDPEIEDFEKNTRLNDTDFPHDNSDHLSLSRINAELASAPVSSRTNLFRVGSTATIRLQRRAGLAKKLKEVFNLESIEEVRAEMPCWLLRSILLQGYMYLTNTYLCFFAHIPCREDQILKSGSLSKKAQRTKRWIKHWFILRNDALSWYQSSSDPYFPHGILDLRYAILCEPEGDKGFRVRTNQKTVHIFADSIPSRDEWIKAIRKVIFKAQNLGDSVKIAIPYSLILEVDKSSAMDFSETVEVKVFDKTEHYSVDSYFFAYFHNISSAVEQIRCAVRAYHLDPAPSAPPQVVLDTTVSRHSITPFDRPVSSPEHSSRSSSVFRIPFFLRPFQDPSIRPTTNVNEISSESDEFTHIAHRVNSTSFIPVTMSSPEEPTENHDSPEALPSKILPPENHTYPPSTSTLTIVSDHHSLTRESSLWSLGVPSWLKGTRRVFCSVPASHEQTPISSPAGVTETYSFSTASAVFLNSRSNAGDLTFSILETPDIPVDPDATEKFRAAFAYDVKETLLGYFPGYIFRLLPIYGRLYISTNFFCFKSSGPLTMKTKMALPIRDILTCEESKATRFGHHGLVIIVKGHEELFFEFGTEDKRTAFIALLNNQMEDVNIRLAAEKLYPPSPGKRDALTLEEFDARPSNGEHGPAPTSSDSLSSSLPAVMFTSASSTFLTFKPPKPLRFTFLTIGSRGDVQPYIALAKGLLADGHKCKIATHGEFKDWIESHGIEFGYVGGDPAELMRICVENGAFTVSFLKEGLLKFRGWVDDLLKTSWEACQDTDVLIESPSAMGGYHIAEVLAIPYFRAFTMTWSRTRAYPHAFAVPERKMGGSYNYMTYIMFDQVFWRATSGQINRWRRNVLQLPSTSLDRMDPHKIPFLYNFSPHVVPPPLDWPEWIRVTGYWFLNEADVSTKKWTPPKDLIAFIHEARSLGKKIVYIGFGSIVVSDPKSMTQCVVEAVLRSDVYAILSKGWSDRLHVKTGDPSELEDPLPRQIFAISSVPHDWLFQKIDAACHHGGAGTTGASLRAGIPTIIRPFFGDQLFWADRVEALGVGSAVRKLTVQALTDALTTATTDIKQIDRARLLGEQIRKENGVATAIESIYRDLEYARSLVKHPPADSEDGDPDKSAPTSSRCGAESQSARSSSGDWSVISEDDRRSSIGTHHTWKDDSAKWSPRRNSFPTS